MSTTHGLARIWRRLARAGEAPGAGAALQRGVDAVEAGGPRARAAAAFLAWLPLLLVNVVAIALLDSRVPASVRGMHYLYDAGQLLALAGAMWLLVLASAPLRRWPAALWALAGALAFGVSHALLTPDLQRFIERHEADVPWPLLFAGAAALGLLAAALIAGRLARTRLWPLPALAGVAAAVGNHLVLELAYPGFHALVALTAALLIAASLMRLRSPWLQRVGTAVAIGACALLALGAYLVPPSPLVRAELLRSTGAVGARYAAALWVRLGDADGAGEPLDPTSPWYASRRDLGPRAPQVVPGRPEAPIVLLLTVDSLRADLLDERQYDRYTKQLRALREQGLSFSRAWSPAPATRATMTALSTGTYYSQQTWKRVKIGSGKGARRVRLPRDTSGPRLAAVLEKAGVETVHLATHPSLHAEQGIMVGFGTERDIGYKARSRVVVDEVLAELDRHFEQGGERPLFLFSHFLDPHNPYTLAGRKKTPKDGWAAEVGLVDRELARLVADITRRKLWDRTYLIVSADHGEGFYEHGLRYHARAIYEEMIHVPLIIRGPGVKPRAVAEPVTLLDLPPTILDIFQAQTPGIFMGESLVGFFDGGAPRLTRPVAVDSDARLFGMLYHGKLKVIVDLNRGTSEVYDLEADPGEKTNLADRPQSALYLNDVRAFLRVHASPSGGLDLGEPDED